MKDPISILNEAIEENRYDDIHKMGYIKALLDIEHADPSCLWNSFYMSEALEEFVNSVRESRKACNQ